MNSKKSNIPSIKKEKTAQIKQRNDKKVYDNVGLRFKKGYKNIIGYIAEENGLTLSGIFKNAITEYIKETIGKDLINKIEFDIDNLINILHRPDRENNNEKFYVSKDDFSLLLDLRKRAEINSDVISAEDFIKLFEYSPKDDRYYFKSTVYNTLYYLVYVANIK